jgi:hypothetical protein
MNTTDEMSSAFDLADLCWCCRPHSGADPHLIPPAMNGPSISHVFRAGEGAKQSVVACGVQGLARVRSPSAQSRTTALGLFPRHGSAACLARSDLSRLAKLDRLTIWTDIGHVGLTARRSGFNLPGGVESIDCLSRCDVTAAG